MEEKRRWINLIKALCAEHQISILEAEKIALTDAQWRRWVARQINDDPECRKTALSHIRCNGAAALIARDGNRLKVLAL